MERLAGPCRSAGRFEIPLRFSSRFLILAISGVAASLAAVPALATMPPPPGRIPPAARAAFERGLRLPPPFRTEAGLCPPPLATWHIPIILAAFADDTLTYAPADFDSALFGTRQAISTGSVREYYHWASGGRVDVTGRVVARVRLPQTLAYYGDDYWGRSGRSISSTYGAIRDALRICQGAVDWSEFDLNHDGAVDILWFIHAGRGGEASLSELPARDRLWSFSDGLSSDPGGPGPFETSKFLPGSTTQYYKIDRFSCLPEMSGLIPGRRSEIGVFCHEFGHALCLPDLYDTSTLGSVVNQGPGNWSLMSTGAYGGNGIQPESPAHPGGWASLFLGWSESTRPAQDTTLRLAPLAGGGPVVEFWFQGESNPEHFLLENRTRDGFDRSLVKAGMIITHVDEALIASRLLPVNRVNSGPNPGLVLVEGDGDGDLLLGAGHGGNNGDPSDPFPGDSLRTAFDDETRPNTRTFGNAVTNIRLSDIALNGNDVTMKMRVRAPGWLPIEDHTDPLFQPYPSTSSGNTAVRNPDGSIDVVSCEFRRGHPQIILHHQTGSGWDPEAQLSYSPGAALAPAITGIPGGDVAVAWSDTRGGRSQIWARGRLEGAWTTERLLADAPGENTAPAIGADAHGRVYVAWLNTSNGVQRVYFTRFVYFAPFGQSLPVSALGAVPDNPAIAVDKDGISYILWPDLADNPRRFWFARFHPDSGLSVPLPLTSTAGAEAGVSALVDTSGTLHLVWQVAGTGAGYEIHYQRRYKSVRPAPRDTALVSSGDQVSDPRLAIDSSGCLHVAYEVRVEGATQIFYKRRRPEWGWDFQGTEVSSTADGSASSPLILPDSPGSLTLLYTGFGSSGFRFMERRRQLVAPPVQAAPLASAASTGPLSLRPNPLRAGQAFELEWAGAAPGPGAVAEIFDVAGRRVSTAALERRGSLWRARFSGTATQRLASGIYFVRPRAAGASAQRLVILR